VKSDKQRGQIDLIGSRVRHYCYFFIRKKARKKIPKPREGRHLLHVATTLMITKIQFLERFLHQDCEEQPYWVTTSLPPEILQKIPVAVKDQLGFKSHNLHFDLLAGIIDECVAEYVEATKNPNAWGGCDAPNTLTHPRIKGLAILPAEQRAGVICAAVQSMRWIDEIQPWIKGHTLQNEIAKRVVVGVLKCFSKTKQSFSASDLKVLANLGACIKGQDSFGIIAQMAIVEILAANIDNLKIDKEMKTVLPAWLKRVAAGSDLASVRKAIDKLKAK
jgi:hypothetical protein